MKKFPYLRLFHGGWPARDLIKKALQNSVNAMKRDKRQEAANDEDDDELHDSDSGNTPPSKLQSNEKPAFTTPIIRTATMNMTMLRTPTMLTATRTMKHLVPR
jgi:hypothetical protein